MIRTRARAPKLLLLLSCFIYISTLSSSQYSCSCHAATSKNTRKITTGKIANTKRTKSLTPFSRGGGATSENRRSTTSKEIISSSSLPQVQTINPHFAVLYGMILAFNAGLINGVTLSGILSSSAIKQASSAVTGAWTNSALSAAASKSSSLSIANNLNLKCILSYMSGSFIAALFNPFPMNYTMKRYTIRPCFLIASLAMYLSHVLVKNDAASSTWILLAVLANGIQNSISSTMTSNLMRSSHYSGMTSDIGTFMGQAVRGNKANKLKLKVFIVLAGSFWIGGFVSLGLVEKLGSNTLLMSSILYLLFGVFSI